LHKGAASAGGKTRLAYHLALRRLSLACVNRNNANLHHRLFYHIVTPLRAGHRMAAWTLPLGRRDARAADAAWQNHIAGGRVGDDK